MESNIISNPQAQRPASPALHKRSTPLENRCSFGLEDGGHFPELISQLLQEGYKVRFRAPGTSMWPAILDGDVLMVEPIEPPAIQMGDIILYQADERVIAHRVIEIEKVESQKFASACRPCHSSTTAAGRKRASHQHYAFILRGDASSSDDEPVSPDQILGKIAAVERHHRSLNPYGLKHKLACRARLWGSRLKRMFIFLHLMASGRGGFATKTQRRKDEY